MASDFIPAAQYLRMSTEHQQYSLQYQAAAIQRYAEFNGFEIVRMYADPARTGVVLKQRKGLQELLRDVCSGAARYRAILVYDVSRWGRFQDADEAAHYEFLCKSAGIPIHYCSETFANDGTLPNMIMKALKRTMAGEYSRELSVKVTAGLKRIASLGFKQGGVPGYGLRRMLVSRDGQPKQQLLANERKGIATDRVILVPGPANEVSVVRNIYKMLISDGLSVHAIAAELNQKGVEYAPDSEWDYAAVYGILTGLKYIGSHAFGRTTSKLYTPKQYLPTSEWIIKSGAFSPIVDYGTFAQAQHVLYYRSLNKSDEEMLDALRQLLRRRGKLSGTLIAHTYGLPSPSTYRCRFGSLQRAYQLIGYGSAAAFGPLELRRKTHALRDELIERLATTFPDELSIFRRGGRWRPKLLCKTGDFVSVLIVISIKHYRGAVRWRVAPVPHENKNVTLLARLNTENRSFFDFWVMPNIDRLRRFDIRENDPWLSRGEPLMQLADFCSAVTRLRGAATERDLTSASHKLIV